MATVPGQPGILLFALSTTEAIVCGTKYIVPDAAHSKTKVNIWNLEGTLITSHVVTPGTRNVRITGLSLYAGQTYRARLQYENSVGVSVFSANALSRVPSELSFDPIEVPTEPTNGGTCPIAPEFVFEPAFSRAIREWQTETLHTVRRPKNTAQRRSLEVRWGPLSESDRDTLRAFLRARIDAVESFTLPTAGGEIEVFVRQGAIEQTHVNADGYVIRVHADEVRGAE
jgi:hypothetical protein